MKTTTWPRADKTPWHGFCAKGWPEIELASHIVTVLAASGDDAVRTARRLLAKATRNEKWTFESGEVLVVWQDGRYYCPKIYDWAERAPFEEHPGIIERPAPENSENAVSKEQRP